MSKLANPLSARALLAKLLAFDTTSRNSNRACIDFVRDYLDSYGIRSDIVPSDDGKKACLWATIGQNSDRGERGIALAGHSDVVPVDGQNWDSDPFTLTERNGKFYGRGTADMKGFIAAALSFVPHFLEANPKGAFHIALTSDEETDMTGAERLTNYLARRDICPDWIWIGEPTEFSIVTQHKGVSAYRTEITGIPGHSSKPDRGLNAIEMTMRFMQILQEVADARRAKPFAPSAFDPPFTTFNFGVVKGGSAENIIAGSCELLWQLRAHPGDRARDFLAEVEERAKAELGPRFAAFAPQAKHNTCVCFDIPPFLATPNNPGEKALKKQLSCTETQAVGFATEAGIFQKLGAPAVICGPGSIDQAHQPNEFVEEKQLTSCVDLIGRTLLSSHA